MRVSLAYLDGTGEQVAVVGETGSEGGTVKEGELGAALGELLLGLERVNRPPEVKHVVLGGGDMDRLGRWCVSRAAPGNQRQDARSWVLNDIMSDRSLGSEGR